MNLKRQAVAACVIPVLIFAPSGPWMAEALAQGAARAGRSNVGPEAGRLGVKPGTSDIQRIVQPEADLRLPGDIIDETGGAGPAAGDVSGKIVPLTEAAGETADPARETAPAAGLSKTLQAGLEAVRKAGEAGSSGQEAGAQEQRARLGEIFGEKAPVAVSETPPVPGAEALGPSEPAPEPIKEFMLRDLDLVRAILKSNYAPASFKERRFGWNLDAEIEKAKEEIRSANGLTIKDYHKILKRMLESTRDYHVSVQFLSTESASLPFTVQGTNGRYFLAWIDRSKLPEDSFPFQAGDELVEFGGRPAADAVREMQRQMIPNAERTDHALASLFLTSRRGSRAMDVPQGPITIAVKPKGSEKILRRQLIWDYTPETVAYNHQAFRTHGFDPARGEERSVWMSLLTGVKDMISPVIHAFAGMAGGNPFGLGTRESYMPPLGPKSWESDPKSLFHAYIYSNDEGRKVGYLRIPSYGPEDPDAALEELAAVVNKFEAETQALVIDQINNPGGSLFYLDALASMLTDQPLTAPEHRIAINPEQYASALQLRAAAQRIQNDAQARMALGKSFGGYPVSYELVKFLGNWARFIVGEWEKGHSLTDPVYAYGVDHINPSAAAKYTKPIVLAVNELDFSGGDFFPNIMQRNKRAELFGVEPAGAGGFVLQFKYPNLLGVSAIHFTGSITEIENSPARPGTRYVLTEADYQDGFKGYANALNEAVKKKLAGSPAPAPSQPAAPAVALNAESGAGGVIVNVRGMSEARAKSLWTQVQAALSVPTSEGRATRMSRPSEAELAALEKKPGFSVRFGGDHAREIYFIEEHAIIYRELNGNPLWERFFKVPVEG